MMSRIFVLSLAAASVTSAGAQVGLGTSGPPSSERTAGQRERLDAGALIIEGTLTEGGVPGPFEKIIDLRTGYSRTTQQMGKDRLLSGFDGQPWSSANGIVAFADLPAALADGRSRAFVDRAGWRYPGAAKDAWASSQGQSPDTILYRPEGGNEVEIVLDKASGLVRQVTMPTDYGPVVTRYEDWRQIGAVRYPFRHVQTGPLGSTILQAQRVRLIRRLSKGALARPPVVPHGRVIGRGPITVAFSLLGTGKSHILVPAQVSGVDTSLLFDTGAGNYITSDSAQKLHLQVVGGLNLGGVGSSSATGGFASVDRISLGSAELHNETIVVGPSPFPPGTHVDGFVGREFLAEFRTTIDYQVQTLTFTRFDEPWAGQGVRIPFYSDGEHIYIEGSVEGHRGLFRIDTGDGGTITIFPEFARRNNLQAGSGTPAAAGGGIGGQVLSREAKLSSFSLAGLSFRDLPASFSQNETGAFASRSLAGNLGAGVLQCFRMTFDYRARTVIFEPKPNVPKCGKGASVSLQ